MWKLRKGISGGGNSKEEWECLGSGMREEPGWSVSSVREASAWWDCSAKSRPARGRLWTPGWAVGPDSAAHGESLKDADPAPHPQQGGSSTKLCFRERNLATVRHGLTPHPGRPHRMTSGAAQWKLWGSFKLFRNRRGLFVASRPSFQPSDHTGCSFNL